MSKLVSMKLDKKEAKEQTEGPIGIKDAPAYPYGLCVELNEESLEKLGLDKLPDIDDEMMLTARVVVTSVSDRATQGGGRYRNVSLQIAEMGLGPEENDSDDDNPSGKLYA